MKEVLSELGITKEGAMSSNGSYVVDLYTYDEYGELFSLLSKNSDLKELEDSTQINIHVTDITYLYKNYAIDLLGDLDNDEYKLVVTKVK